MLKAEKRVFNCGSFDLKTIWDIVSTHHKVRESKKQWMDFINDPHMLTIKFGALL